jgi:carbon monoxide dehydrogenase subunit G
MQLEHGFTVPVPAPEAWRVLLDVPAIAPCLPGATVEAVDGDTITGRVRVKVGPVQITYRGTARFVQTDEAGHRAVIQASGKETRGSGTATATVTTILEPAGDETRVRVVTDLAVTGRPAQFGRGVMADVGAKLIGQFSTCLADKLRGEPAAAPAAAGAAGPAATAGEAVPPAPPDAPLLETPSSGPEATSDALAPPPPPVPEPAVPVPPPVTVPAGDGPVSGVAAADGSPAAAAEAGAGEPAGTAPLRPVPGAAERPAFAPPPAEAPPIDLLAAAGAPVAKRLAPVAAGLGVLAVVVILWRRRRAGR